MTKTCQLGDGSVLACQHLKASCVYSDKTFEVGFKEAVNRMTVLKMAESGYGEDFTYEMSVDKVVDNLRDESVSVVDIDLSNGPPEIARTGCVYRGRG